MNKENDIFDISANIDSLAEAFVLAGSVEDNGESSANLIDLDIDQVLA